MNHHCSEYYQSSRTKTLICMHIAHKIDRRPQIQIAVFFGITFNVNFLREKKVMHTEDILCVLNNRLSRILKLQPQRCNDKPFSHKYTRKKEAFKRDVYECACMCAYEPFSASLVLPFLLAKCLPHTR